MRYNWGAAAKLALLAFAGSALLPMSFASAQEAVVRVLRSAVGTFQPLYIAEEQGYFAEAGIKVEISVGGAPAQMVTQAVAAQTDLAMVGFFELTSAVAQGLPVVATLNVQDIGDVATQGLLTAPNSAIEQVSDLVGKKLGVPGAQQSTQGLMVMLAFENAGLKATDANLVNIPFDTVIESAENGNVDAITPVGLFYATAIGKGFNIVPDVYEQVKGAPAVIFIANKDWANANADTLTKFNQALQKAYEYGNAHPEAVRAIDTAQTKQPPEYIATRQIAPFVAEFQRDVWLARAEDMYRLGLIPKAPTEADLIWEGAP